MCNDSTPATLWRRGACSAALAIGVPLLLSGCVLATSMNKKMASWQGHSFVTLLMAWGPPQAIYDDGSGGRIVVYTVSRQWTTPGTVTTTTSATARLQGNTIWGQAQSLSTFVPPQTQGYTAWRMFSINSRGIIYSWQWRGL